MVKVGRGVANGGCFKMNSWPTDELHALVNSDSVAAVFTTVAKAARGLGFEYCAFGLRLPLPVSGPRLMAISNYPEAWQRRYRDQAYLAVDPTVRHGINRVTPLIWSQQVFSGAQELWEDARSYGLAHGWMAPCHDGHGVCSMLTFARSAEELGEPELAQKLPMLQSLSQAAHEKISVAVVPKLMPEIAVALTGREVDALRWTAEGKTSAEIGEIVGIAERTVVWHLNNAVAKLGAGNKTAAVVRAAVLGMLN